MDSLDRVPAEYREKVRAPEIKGLEGLPESVHGAFWKLPEQMKKRIFPENFRPVSESGGSNKGGLEDVVAGFDTETRERFSAHCLSEVFYHGRFKEVFEKVDGVRIKEEIIRLLDLFWSNRGKGDQFILFNKGYYENFFKVRCTLEEAVIRQQKVVDELKDFISKNPKKRRLVEKKNIERRTAEGLLAELKEDLMVFDNRNENSEFDFLTISKDVKSRQRRESEWTAVLTITVEYLDADEYATVVFERLEGLFYFEKNVFKGQFRKASEDEKLRAEKTITALKDAVNEWFSVHEGEKSFKSSNVVKLEERQEKMIEYFHALIASYLRGKKIGKSNNDLVVEIRQMEVLLNLLEKHKK